MMTANGLAGQICNEITDDQLDEFGLLTVDCQIPVLAFVLAEKVVAAWSAKQLIGCICSNNR